MRIRFGMFLDGAAWTGLNCTIGETVCGPRGMVNILAARMGLTHPSASQARRIAASMRRLEAIDAESEWFHASFVVDAWSTAQEILSWRDELVAFGWDGSELSGSPRLVLLSRLERSSIPLPPGEADDLIRVLRELQSGTVVTIDRIELQEPNELLPQVWQEVFRNLSVQGTKIIESPIRVTAKVGLLANVQRDLIGTEPEKLTESDGSVVILQHSTEWEAAEETAMYLLADRENNRNVSIICSAPTHVLDTTLTSFGLPVTGRPEVSHWREALQLLPLLLKNAWNPVDISSIADLLSLRCIPYAGMARRCLMDAFHEEPGVGGEAWKTAMKKILEIKTASLTKQGKSIEDASSQAESYTRELEDLLVNCRFDPSVGIPEERVTALCDYVIETLGFRAESDPSYASAIHAARELEDLVEGRSIIPRVLLERMLDSINGDGISSNIYTEEASEWQVLEHPGQSIETCDTLIWWGFQSGGSGSSIVWSAPEKAALSRLGVALEDPAIRFHREEFAWKRAICSTGKNFLAIFWQKTSGEENALHPFAENIRMSARKAFPGRKESWVNSDLIRTGGFLDHSDRRFAGRESILVESPSVIFPSMSASVTIASDAVAKPERLSFSQMDTLLACPMKWMFEKHAGIRPLNSMDIPTGNQMIGTLCHKIIELIFVDGGAVPEPQDAQAQAMRLYDDLLPSLASELLLPGVSVERGSNRVKIGKAVGELTKILMDNNLRVEAVEKEIGGMLGEYSFTGRIDLLAKNMSGKYFIIDMKWTYSDRKKKEEVENLEDLQLSLYSRFLAESCDCPEVDSGYYMLKQHVLLSTTDLEGVSPIVPVLQTDSAVEKGHRALDKRFSQIEEGLIIAQGVDELLALRDDEKDVKKIQERRIETARESGEMYRVPPCKYCDYSYLCGYAEGMIR